jgi:uncharacterized membrane-anchored protein
MLHASLRLRIREWAAILVVSLLGVTVWAAEEASEPPQLGWQPGPLTAPIGDSIAEIELPAGFVFLPKQDTVKLLELMENPTSGDELATLAAASEDESWLVFFEWNAVGWVDDSEKDDLDAGALLESIQEGTKQSNEERKRRGWATIDDLRWRDKPHYDERTHNLTWAIEGTSAGRPVLNRMVKLLGRRGVMNVTIVSDPEEFDTASAATDQLLTGYRFQPGSTYAEYLPGKDEIATYGLTALVAGGLGAAAVKSGLFAKLWKGLVVVALGALAWVKRLITGRKHIADPPTPV